MDKTRAILQVRFTWSKPGIIRANKMVVDPDYLDGIIRSGCKAAIAAEPNLTKWDMVMGDGDCGEAVHGVSQGECASIRHCYTVR